MSNISNEGFLISRPVSASANQGVNKVKTVSPEKDNSLNSESLNQNLSAMNSFYGDGQQLSDIKTGEVDRKLFEARKKVVDPQGLIPDEVRTGGISAEQLNKQGKNLSIGTFNVEWLGSDEMNPRSEKDYETVANMIKKSGADVLSLEEVSNEKGLKKVLKYLPDYDYVIGDGTGMDENKSQRIAIIYNKNKMECDKSSLEELHVINEKANKIAGNNNMRAPLAVKMKSKDGGFDFTMVGMHLKAKMDDRSVSIRTAQTEAMNKWLKNEMAHEPDKDIIVVGDCNDMLGSKSLNALSQGNVLHMTTAEAAARGEFSHHWKYQSLIDHVGTTTTKGGSDEEYIPGTTKVVQGDSNSDHNPVVAVFKDVDND